MVKKFIFTRCKTILLILLAAVALGYLVKYLAPAEPQSGEQSVKNEGDKSAVSAGNATAGTTPAPGEIDDSKAEAVPQGPRDPDIREAVQAITDTSSEGLVEEAAEDGYQVNLQGRFRSVPVAEVNDKGEVEIRDYTADPINNKNE